ncbi:MAG: prolyl oligopeptidase family serine peptidase [Proteobacteria bacterium]|nr:prolyl oligopeptidase family serine peptidase [Pseudomonadota bacterium]
MGAPRIGPDGVYWLEGRPSDGGRQSVWSAGLGQPPRRRTAAGVNVRSRVHEYGGGEYAVHRGSLFYVDFTDGQVYRQDPDGDPRRLTREAAHHADLVVSPDGRWLVCVQERPRDGDEPENRLVVVSTDGGPARAVATDHDFVSSPAFRPDGARLAYLTWDHPNMPWNGTCLWSVAWREGRPDGTPYLVAGGERESVTEPRFRPEGGLVYVSDRSGWWNLYQARDGGSDDALCPRPAEFTRPPWVFGLASYAPLAGSRLVCRFHEPTGDCLALLDLERGDLEPIPTPFSVIEGVRAEGERVVFCASGPDRTAGIYALDLVTRGLEAVRRPDPLPTDAAGISSPEAVVFDSADGRRAHAFFYAPTRAAPTPPPLLVKSHGGPTAATAPALDPRIQFWTSRGFAVVDVNYGGSTGYGRPYRELLHERWGIVDVEDCVAAARFLAEQGRVDGRRLAISGGSAGGYTTLCALVFHDAFSAGASHYGIGDLEALARDTHKFESRYTDWLVGPYPEARERYRERSPIHFTERLSCPVIFFQGLEDRVVPPNQAEAMVAALAAQGTAHAYVPFAGEQHGFRREESIRVALEGEHYFYARVFGMDAGEPPVGVRIAGSLPA